MFPWKIPENGHINPLETLHFFSAVVDEEGGVGGRHRQEGETIVGGL